MNYPDAASYEKRLQADAVLPEGFKSSVTTLGFIPAEKPHSREQRMNLSLIRLDNATDSFAAMFTRNAFPGWPVIIGRELMNASKLQGILINNRVSNVRSSGGLEASRRLCRSLAEITGDSSEYLPSSTGVIGWKLPVEAMEKALPELVASLSADSLLPVARAIMTTDAWPKVRSSVCGEGRIVGTAKGAGMIEPNMATMLSFLLTDVAVPREAARRILADVVGRTYNRISIDGETSTSDTVVLVSSGRKPYPGDGAFSEALMSVAHSLSQDIVRNGEGTAHVFRVSVRGVPDVDTATFLARSVANAPLTKTAIRGNDPNVGRILQAVGAACGRRGMSLNAEKVSLEIAGRRVFSNGVFQLGDEEETILTNYMTERELPLPAPLWPMHEEVVEIEVNLGEGPAQSSVTASDLSEEYISINADYRT